ncbi:trimeric intracellular cation channel family protein [Mesobacterium pallidum]|uniref:trimeric intracellular cation channel family protein n=1 Tax=Mesobacterium pallidum TaxID=2872037 RepID=UPI001EE21050|nr:trimeric intracellular cation channel family protein [Mesobacterium pallidum]
MTSETILLVFDILGTFAFGLSGALVAIRRQLDLFGILVLAAATGVAGGITRDLLIGATPPAALRDLWPLALAAGSGLVAVFTWAQLERVSRPVMLLDALGLGTFAVAGTQTALDAGLHAPGAVLLGMISAVGGGVLRDMMSAEVPRVLREDIYALAALAGAIVYVGALSLGLPEGAAAAGAVALAVVLRIASVRYGWTLPRAPGS